MDKKRPQPFYHNSIDRLSDHGIKSPDGSIAPPGWYFEKFEDEDEEGQTYAAFSGPFDSLDRAQTEMRHYQRALH